MTVRRMNENWECCKGLLAASLIGVKKLMPDSVLVGTHFEEHSMCEPGGLVVDLADGLEHRSAYALGVLCDH